MKITPAMRRALDLLAAGPARYSNYTGRGRIWQRNLR